METISDLKTVSEVVDTFKLGVDLMLDHWLIVLFGLLATVGLSYAAFIIRNWKLAAAAVGLCMIGFLFVGAYSTGFQAHQKLAAAAVAEETRQAMEIVIQGKQDAIDELRATNKLLEQHAADLNTLIEEIRRAKPKDDGPVAPVLRNTLRHLDVSRVRQPSKPKRPKG